MMFNFKRLYRNEGIVVQYARKRRDVPNRKARQRGFGRQPKLNGEETGMRARERTGEEKEREGYLNVFSRETG